MLGYDPNDGPNNTREGRMYFVDGSFVAYRASSVPSRDRFLEGIKYAFQYVAADGTPILRYDNAHGVHERHDGPGERGEPIPYAGDVQSHFRQLLSEVHSDRDGGLE